MPLTGVKTQQKRSTSLKRVKNSTEVLKERTTRLKKATEQTDTRPDTRNGRNFAIGNVGTGGTFYLRPSPLPRSPPASPKNDSNAMPPIVHVLVQNGDQFTRLETATSPNPPFLPIATPRVGQRLVARDDTDLKINVRRTYRGRSQSISTIEEHRASLSAARSRRLRIVINRPEAEDSQSIDGLDEKDPRSSLPLLQVPIPHYKIGTPRFSTHGTPTLRASGFSRTSAAPSDSNQSIVSSQVESLFPAPPGTNLQGIIQTDGLPSSTNPSHKPWTVPPLRTVSMDTTTTQSTLRGPTQARVYDELEQLYDDPSVVRYSQNVREITAATPARIIAQISSESFMDYELVSDFFLTFRSYMTTYSVLGYLLARLRWAIGRQEDNGKIVRVRAFAALRHWVLNYFVDDFIPDYDLRMRFCDGVNKLYADVRTRFGYDASNLKVLRDLKRCWNGRCSLHWDSPSFNVEGTQDSPLNPGDDLELHSDEGEERVSSPLAESHNVIASTPAIPFKKPSTDGSWLDIQPEIVTDPLASHLRSPGRQQSTISDGSLQPKSCSIPKELLKPQNVAVTRFARPQLVSVQTRRKNAPSNLQVSTHTSAQTSTRRHRRGASSIDSNREQTPRTSNVSAQPFQNENLSLIRGNVVQPCSPFVKVPQSPVPPSAIRPEFDQSQQEALKRLQLSPSGGSPGMRNILGSLRKALGSKHAQSEAGLVTVSGPLTNPHLRNKRSNMPLNLSKSYDELRTKTVSVASKPQMRIDLLCAAVAQSYAAACVVANNPPTVVPPSRQAGRTLQGLDDDQPPPVRGLGLGEDLLRRQRLASQMTDQSGSILIVDDTHPDMPVMAGALGSWPVANQEQIAEASSSSNGTPRLEPSSPKQDDHHSTILTQRSSGVLGTSPNQSLADPIGAPNAAAACPSGPHVPARTSSVIDAMGVIQEHEGQTPQQNTKSMTDSTIRTPNSSDGEQSTPRTTISQPTHHADLDKTVASVSRRLPGGELRNTEYYHNLRLPPVPESRPASALASPSASLIIMSNREQREIPKQKTVTAGPGSLPKVSMINTHSSQHLRPSFEAAVGGFSSIPDDDDGGLEATLLKLEGRYDKTTPPLGQPASEDPDADSLKDASLLRLSDEGPGELTTAHALGSPFQARRSEVAEIGLVQGDDCDEDAISSRHSSIFGMPRGPLQEQHASQSSIPLLKRETIIATIEGSAMPSADYPPVSQKGSPSSVVSARCLQSLQRPDTSHESAQSFFVEKEEDEDDDDARTDLSSEISVDIINYSDVVDRSISPMIAAPGTAISGLEIPSHPLTYVSGVTLNMPPEKLIDEFSPSLYPRPLKTNYVPRRTQPSSSLYPDTPASILPSPRLSTGPAHFPFVLTLDSQTLAQQFTLVEKSALCEIEWSDLVEMRWDNKSADILNWAEYLMRTDIKGIDLVITRFNLVVKWALSEIVLTQDVRERAQVITKLIHVAAHARRLRNYATMLQLTIALTSSDCTRLSATWGMVSGPDRSLLKNMESLMQPIRNFHDLRTEMESADVSEGCIPFIGLYVHDLTYNAQKPSHITSRHGGEDLVNFERFRTAAVIVKGLLRLIDASSRYDFPPLEGTIERCLWLACLSDERVRYFSHALEG